MFEKVGAAPPEARPGPFDVRRLVVLDLHGWKGTRRRRLVVTSEFVATVVAGLGLGSWLLAVDGDPWPRLFGVVLIGIGCNFVPLTLFALQFRRPGALSAELAGIDLGRQLKRYTLLSLWLAVPFLVAVLAVVQRRRAGAPG